MVLFSSNTMNQILKIINSSPMRFRANGLNNIRALSNNKDLTKHTSATTTTDLLINNLKNAKSISNVLDLVSSHHNIMNSNHTVQALKTIFILQKNSNADISRSQLLKDVNFQQICNKLNYHAGALALDQVLEALKVISFLGVSSDSTIYQILLNLLRHSVNDLSLQQIIFTGFLLSKAKSSSLVDALKIALPIVYDINVAIKLDQSNFSALPEHLHYVSKHNISEKSTMLIVNAMMKVKVFDAKNCVSILWSLCDMQPNVLLEPLLNKAIKSLFIAGYTIPYRDLETIISKMTTKHNAKTQFHYDESFYDYCANAVVNQDLGFEVAVHLLRKFLRVGHANTNLLDYISDKCYENTDLIENGDPILTHNVLRGCALTDFRPKNYEVIKQSFLKIKQFSSFEDSLLLQLQTALCVLNIYVPEILERTLNEDNLKKSLRKNNVFDFHNVLLITQAIKTFKPDYNNYLPSEEYMHMVKSKVRSVSAYPLEGSLHHMFGGETFVKTSVFTKMFHYIDHLILLKKDGFATSLGPEDLYVENIRCESPSQIVLIMALSSSHYTVNQHLLGSTSLMLQTLEAKGYSVVPICIKVWKLLPDFEKIPYIVEAIRSKTEYFDKVYDVS